MQLHSAFADRVAGETVLGRTVRKEVVDTPADYIRVPSRRRQVQSYRIKFEVPREIFVE